MKVRTLTKKMARRTVGIVLTTLLASAIGRAQDLPATCDPEDPQSCLYVSDLSYPISSTQLTRLDPNRGNYPVPLLIRYPIGTNDPRPVVIWHHGGNPHPNGRARSAEWGRALAEAGYVVIHPSRVTIANPAPFEAECRDNGFDTPEECAYWVSNFRYGPLTTTFLIDSLNQLMVDVPALRGRIDVSKIVVGGHSAGSTGPLANAGAWQQWVEDAPKYFTIDSRPIAFIASAPQGPMYAGFGSGFQAAPFDGNRQSSYAGIERAFLFITGVGDETQEPPESRVTGWLSALPGTRCSPGTSPRWRSTRRWTSTSAIPRCGPNTAPGSNRPGSRSSTPWCGSGPKLGSGSRPRPMKS